MNLFTYHAEIKEEYNKARDSHKLIAYKYNYFLTKKEYTGIMNLIDDLWKPCNQSNYTFVKGKLNMSLARDIIRTRINP